MADETQKRSGPDLDSVEKKWQILSTQMAVFVTVAGLLAGGVKYLNQRHDEASQRHDEAREQARIAAIAAETARRESQKPFLQKQLDTCSEAVAIVGSLAAENENGVRVNPEDHRRTLDQFWVHYHGSLSVVENDQVEAAMVSLGNRLRICEQEHTKCNLQSEANRLAHACRDVVFQGWDAKPLHYNP